MDEISAPDEKKLSAGEQEKLLRAPTFWEQYGKRVWLVVLVLFLLVLGYKLVIKQNPRPNQNINLLAPTETLPTPAPSPTTDPTVNWKTYTNTKYGFSLKIPSTMNYTFSENINHNSQLGIKSLDQVSFYEGQPAEIGGYTGPSFNIEVFPEIGNEPWIEEDQSPSDSVSDFVISGTSVRRLSGLAGVRTGPLKKAGYIYEFHNINGNNFEKEIDQILSTFKFTEQK